MPISSLGEPLVCLMADRKLRASGATLLYRNDRNILQYAAKIHEDFVNSLQNSIGEDAFDTMIFLQPVTRDYARIAEEKGGNMLGLESMESKAWRETP